MHAFSQHWMRMRIHPCMVAWLHPSSQPASQPSSHPAIHPSIHPSIHPPTHPPMFVLMHGCMHLSIKTPSQIRSPGVLFIGKMVTFSLGRLRHLGSKGGVLFGRLNIHSCAVLENTALSILFFHKKPGVSFEKERMGGSFFFNTQREPFSTTFIGRK